MGRKEGKEMGFSSGRMEKEKTREKRRGVEEGKKFDEVFSHIETRVDLKRGQIEQAKAAGRLRERKAEPFEVNEKAVVLALNLSEALSKNPKALDRW